MKTESVNKETIQQDGSRLDFGSHSEVYDCGGKPMNVQAEVSLYPLRSSELSGPIRRFCEALRKCGLDIETGRMSTSISGDLVQVFDGLKLAMAAIGKDNEIVLVAKVSNACSSGSESVGKRLPPS